MEKEEIKGRKVTIDIVKANWFAVIVLVVSAIAFFVPFVLIWKGRKPTDELTGGYPEFWQSTLLLIAGIVVHELIHGVTWACYAKSGWKSISFGVMWKFLTPYCHCSEPMHVRGYIMGAMMPCVVLGIVPAVAALCIGSLPLLMWGIVFIAAAAGDIWISWLLAKESPGSLVLDHPSEAGFYIIDESE